MSANLLILGDFFSTAMEPVRLCVETLIDGGSDARFAASVSRISERPDDTGWFPDLIVVCQQWPDEFTEQDVRRLFTLYPLARLTCCYALWCESDGRNRDIWPHSVRVPVRCAAARIGRELEVIAGTTQPLPLTASRDEIFLFDADGPVIDRVEFC
jgi:hypothetical protein